MPNSSEILFLALMVATSFTNGGEMVAWARRVLAKEPAAADLPEGKLPEGVDLQPMEYAYTVYTWSEEALDNIGTVMKAWRGPGKASGLQYTQLRKHLYCTANRKGPPGPCLNPRKPKEGPSRWRTQALFKVAALVKERGAEMRHLLKADLMYNEVAEPWEAIETLEKEKAAAEQARDEAKKEAEKAVDRDRKRKEYEKKHKKACAVVRDAERSKVQEKVGEIREELKEEAERKEAEAMKKLKDHYAEFVEQQRKGKCNAQARARAAEAETAKAERKAARLEKNLKGLETVREEEMELDDPESDSESDEPQASRLNFEVRARRDERGRWQAEDEDLHAVRLAQLGRGVAASTVPANIQDVLDLVAPELEIPAPCERSSQIQRGEVTLTGEAMAAWKFAKCKRVMTVGWDESTTSSATRSSPSTPSSRCLTARSRTSAYAA